MRFGFRMFILLVMCGCATVAGAENYISRLVSELRPEFQNLPPALVDTYATRYDMERAQNWEGVIALLEKLTETKDLPPDVRTYFLAEQAHALEVVNRHPEAIVLMRQIIAERPEPEAEQIRYLLDLEIARVMDDSGGAPSIKGFDPTIDEMEEVHLALFEKYYPYRHELMELHIKYGVEAEYAAGDSADPRFRFWDVAVEQYTTVLRQVVDILINPNLAYDERTLNSTEIYFNYAIDRLADALKRRDRELRTVLDAPAAFGLIRGWPAAEDGLIYAGFFPIESPNTARVRRALEAKRRPESEPVLQAANDGPWRKIDANGRFSFSAPPSLKDVPVHGIDSYVGHYADDTISLSFDYGAYSSTLQEVEGGSVEQVRIDNRPAKLVIADSNAPQFTKIVAIHFPKLAESGIGPIGLTMFAQCRAEVDVQTVLRIYRSIDFP